MNKLQRLREKISTGIVDLKVEKKRLQTLEDTIKVKYDIDPDDIKDMCDEVSDKRDKCKKKMMKLKEKLEQKLKEYKVKII